MQLDQTITHADFTFTTIDGGKYLWQVQEGIELKDKINTKTGQTDRSYWVPVQVCGVIPGESKDMNAVASGAKGLLFINPGKPSGAKQFNALLNATRLMPQMIQSFGAQIDEYGTAVQGFLKQFLPGKVVKLTHELKESTKDGQTTKNMNFLDIDSPTPVNGAVPGAPAAPGIPGQINPATGQSW
jgi:hypothetical protein